MPFCHPSSSLSCIRRWQRTQNWVILTLKVTGGRLSLLVTHRIIRGQNSNKTTGQLLVLKFIVHWEITWWMVSYIRAFTLEVHWPILIERIVDPKTFLFCLKLCEPGKLFWVILTPKHWFPGRMNLSSVNATCTSREIVILEQLKKWPSWPLAETL